MGYITNYNYYLNEGVVPESKNHGSYQYISLPDIINNYMLIYVGDDKVVDNVKKHIVRFHAKQAIKDLNYNAFRNIKVLETTIGSDLKLIMPSGYVDYIRLSMESNGVLYPLTQNTKPMSAVSYLKDNNDELLFDNTGEVLYGSSELDSQRLSATPATYGSAESAFCNRYSIGGQYGLDTSEANSNPRFRINRASGVIDFDSNMRDKLVVIEYISDGMEGGVDSDIVIHKFFERYMYSYLTAEILDAKRGVSAVEKRKAAKKKEADGRNARIMISDIDPSRLLMTLRGQDNQIK